MLRQIKDAHNSWFHKVTKDHIFETISNIHIGLFHISHLYRHNSSSVAHEYRRQVLKIPILNKQMGARREKIVMVSRT
jgi:hypothetical protein